MTVYSTLFNGACRFLETRNQSYKIKYAIKSNEYYFYLAIMQDKLDHIVFFVAEMIFPVCKLSLDKMADK